MAAWTGFARACELRRCVALPSGCFARGARGAPSLKLATNTALYKKLPFDFLRDILRDRFEDQRARLVDFSLSRGGLAVSVS